MWAAAKRFRKELKRVSPELRLRFDDVIHRFRIEQRTYQGAWEQVFVIQFHGGGFRFPDQSDIVHLKINDTHNLQIAGRTSMPATEAFMDRMGEGRRRREKDGQGKSWQLATELADRIRFADRNGALP